MEYGLTNLKKYIARYNRKRIKVIASNLDAAIKEAIKLFGNKPTEVYLVGDLLV